MHAFTNRLALPLRALAITGLGLVSSSLPREASAQCGGDILTLTDPFENAFFGKAIAMQGDRAFIGAPALGWGPNRGAVYVYERTSIGWVEMERIKQPRRDFGRSLSVSGDTLAVGARGRVYVFEDGANGWAPTQTLTPPAGMDHFGAFGYSVALEDDTLVVGVAMEFGAVLVYERQSGQWDLTRRLRASRQDPWDLYGYRLAIDQGTIVVSSWSYQIFVGAVYVYEPSTDPASEETVMIEAPNPSEIGFGTSVSLSEDTLLISTDDDSIYFIDRAGDDWRVRQSMPCWGNAALLDDMAAAYCNPNKLEVYGRTAGVWTKRTTLEPGRLAWGAGAGEIALSHTTVMAAHPHDDLADDIDDAGAVYVFDLDSPGRTYCCPAEPNSTGESGRLLAYGSRAVLDDDLSLTAKGLPTRSFGTVLMSDGSDVFTPPGSSGPACLGGGTSGILHVQPAGLSTDQLAGGFSISPGTSGLPTAVMAGTTWNFQAWYRDNAAGTSNFTDAVSVTFE